MPLSSHYYPIIIPLLFHDYPIMISWLFHYYSIIIPLFPLLSNYYSIIKPWLSHYHPIISPLLSKYYTMIISLFQYYSIIIIPLLSNYHPIIIPLSFHDYSDQVAALGTRHQASIPPVAQLLTAIGSASGRLTEKHHRERGDGQLDGQQLEFQPLNVGMNLRSITIWGYITNQWIGFRESRNQKPCSCFFYMRIFCMMFQKRFGTMWHWVRIQLCWSLSFGHLIWFLGFSWYLLTHIQVNWLGVLTIFIIWTPMGRIILYIMHNKKCLKPPTSK